MDKQNAREQPPRHRDKHKAEGRFDMVHPRPRPRQEAGSGRAEQNQRYSLSKTQAEQGGSSKHSISGLCDIQQRSCQGGRHTWADDEGRRKAHTACRNQRASTCLCRPAKTLGPPARQGQIKASEHRGCQHKKDDGKSSDSP